MLADIEWLFLLLMIALLWLAWPHQPSMSPHAGITDRLQRRLSPRTPDDCPICRQQMAHPTVTGVPRPPIIPWRERKSPRGRPKRITTQGFAALVGDGVDGTSERIQSLRCQACN